MRLKRSHGDVEAGGWINFEFEFKSPPRFPVRTVKNMVNNLASRQIRFGLTFEAGQRRVAGVQSAQPASD